MVRDARSVRAFESAQRTPKVLREGTHRSQSLEDTLRHVLRLAPIMGVTRVANVTGLDPVGIPVVMVCRPNSRSLAVSQGKGIDLGSARASGLMDRLAFPGGKLTVWPLLSASSCTSPLGLPRYGLRAKPQLPSKQIRNDQDCFGGTFYSGDHARSTTAYTVEPIDISYWEQHLHDQLPNSRARRHHPLDESGGDTSRDRL